MCDIVDEIAQIHPFLIDQALDALVKRYAVLFPDYDLITISLNKKEDKNEQLDRMILLLQNMKDAP